MQTYPQQLASALAAMAKNTTGGMVAMTSAAAPLQPRRRSISEILDVDASFVDGYPLHVERAGARD
jgi:hypothetical protein